MRHPRLTYAALGTIGSVGAVALLGLGLEWLFLRRDLFFGLLTLIAIAAACFVAPACAIAVFVRPRRPLWRSLGPAALLVMVSIVAVAVWLDSAEARKPLLLLLAIAIAELLICAALMAPLRARLLRTCEAEAPESQPYSR